MSIALTGTNWESKSIELVRTALRLSTLALVAVAIAANFTDYGPLIPLLQQELHITGGATGLLSTLLYVGIGLSYLPGGWLADRYGSRRVLFGSLLLVEAGGCLLPLIPNLVWIVLCRLVIGLGVGSAIVAGSQAACRGKYSALGQGLFGGAMQLGAGLGMFATPTLQSLFGWRGTFTAWGALGLGVSVLCLLALSGEGETPQPTTPAPRRIATAFRSPSLWTIGLVHLGTLGLGQAVAPWLAVYFSLSYGLPLELAATLGAVGLLAGMIFRPLGGALLSHKVFTASALMRAGTALACAGVVMLALPLHEPLVTGWGLALFACGTTLPYAAVFDEAGHIGAGNDLGSGTAQGVISVISAPASAFGPLLIGGLLGQRGDFALPFGTIALLGGVALVAALFVGPIVSQIRDAGNLTHTWEPDAYLAQALATCPSASLPATTLPAIVALGSFPSSEGAATIQRLQHAGGLPLILPAPPSPDQGEAGDLLADEDFFREIFDQRIWPLFCQLLLGQTRGICLVEDGQGSEKTNGAYAIDTGDLLQREASDPWNAITQRYLSLLACLIGMPVLGAGWELQSLQLNYRVDEQGGTAPKRLWPLPANPVACSGSAEGSSVFSQFVAACVEYTPPSPQALASFRDEIFGWLRRRDRALIRQMYWLQLAYGQGTTGMFEAIEPVPAQRSVEQEVAGKAGSRKKEKIAA